MMSRAISIHIGVNRPQEWRGETLRASEYNAWNMAVLASQAGYSSIQVLRGAEATHDAVHEALSDAVQLLQGGDTLLFSYSGHGSRVNEKGELDEDGCDEAMCLYDDIMLDDALAGHWQQFARGVRIVAVMESCFSGGLMRGYEVPPATGAPAYGSGPGARDAAGSAQPGGSRGAMRTPFVSPLSGATPSAGPQPPEPYRYDEAEEARLDALADADRRTAALSHDLASIQASLLLLAASDEDRKSRDGVFTRHLLRVWRDGQFDGSYHQLYQRVYQRVIHEVDGQKPQLLLFGAPDPEFAQSPAFRPRPRPGPGGAMRSAGSIYRGYQPPSRSRGLSPKQPGSPARRRKPFG